MTDKRDEFDPIRELTGMKQKQRRVAKEPREKQKAIISWHNPAVRMQIALLAAEHGTTRQKLMAEAINLLFEKYGKPQIA